jgi:hypothetical protein
VGAAPAHGAVRTPGLAGVGPSSQHRHEAACGAARVGALARAHVLEDGGGIRIVHVRLRRRERRDDE